MQAYQYLALCAFNKDNREEMNNYLGKIDQLEPGNAFAKQLRDVVSRSSKPSGKR